MIRLFAAAALLALPTLAAAQTDTSPETPRKIRNVQLYGDDKCPTASFDEIVVCQRAPEGDRYRVPKRFRDAEISPKNRAWAARAAADEDTSRIAGGLPDTCSPVGSGGQTGCAMQAAQAYAAAKRAKRQADADVPGNANSAPTISNE